MIDEKLDAKLYKLINNHQIDDALKLMMSVKHNESEISNENKLTEIDQTISLNAFCIMDAIREDMVKQSYIISGIITQNRFVEVEKQSNNDYHPYQKEELIQEACKAIRKDEQRLGLLEDLLSLITVGHEAIEY